VAIQRLAEATMTLYAELLEQVRNSGAIPRTGSFVSKTINGTRYWYVQRVDGGRKKQIYLGAETDELLTKMQRAGERTSLLADEQRRRRELVSMLSAGGMAVESAAVGKVLSALDDAGLFRAGAVLVGTQAFSAIANMLGVRFEAQSLRTADVDVGHPPITLAVGAMQTDLLEDLRETDPRFVAVPGLDPLHPSTSFKVRGRDLRVDLLTPGRDGSKPLYLPHLNAAALPLSGLDYLLGDPVDAVIVSSDGILLQVPSPARFALHKLWVSRRRNPSEQGKARKDVRQASQIIEVLLDDRPGDLILAWSSLRPAMLNLVRRGCVALTSDARARLAELVRDASISRR
jgi:hypothetical protein